MRLASSVRALAAMSHARGLRIHPVVGTEDRERLLPALHEISMKGFAESFLFEPINVEEFGHLHAASGTGNASISQVAMDPSGFPVGFLLAFIDEDYAVFKSLVLQPNYRGRGTASALFHHALRAARDRGIVQAISALVRDGNRSELFERRMAKKEDWRHDYVLMSRRL